MISFISSWIEQIIIAIIIVSIIEMLLPSGNIKKYVKIILSVFVIFNILSPFVNSIDLFNFSTQNFDTYINNSNTLNKSNTLDQSFMDKRLQELYVEELENNVKNKLNENGYFVKGCSIDATLDSTSSNAGINKITLVISKNRNSIREVEKINIGDKNQVNRDR